MQELRNLTKVPAKVEKTNSTATGFTGAPIPRVCLELSPDREDGFASRAAGERSEASRSMGEEYRLGRRVNLFARKGRGRSLLRRRRASY